MLKLKTLIHHITYYEYDRSVYIQFLGCNLRCLGCIRKLYIWDHHLGQDELNRLGDATETITLQELEELLVGVKKGYGLDRAILGGGEPTVDPVFCHIMGLLVGLGIDITLLTNGYEVDKVIHCIPKDVVLELSLKSIHPDKFYIYTGGDLEKVLRNLDLVIEKGFRVLIETILIPGLNTAEDIEALAKYISKRFGRDIALVIDEYIPVPRSPWGRPSLEELLDAYTRASLYLDNVIVRSNYPVFKTSERLGNVFTLYPRRGFSIPGLVRG